MEGRELEDSLSRLRDVTQEVARGEYAKAQSLFNLTGEEHAPAIRDLAESFGLMLVQVEAREVRLEGMVSELEEKNRELETTLGQVRALEKQLSDEVISLRQACTWIGFALLAVGVVFVTATVFVQLALAQPLSGLVTRPGMWTGVITLVAGGSLVRFGRGNRRPG